MQSQNAHGGQGQPVGINSFLYCIGSGDETLVIMLGGKHIITEHLTNTGNSPIITPNLSIFFFLPIYSHEITEMIYIIKVIYTRPITTS